MNKMLTVVCCSCYRDASGLGNPCAVGQERARTGKMGDGDQGSRETVLLQGGSRRRFLAGALAIAGGFVTVDLARPGRAIVAAAAPADDGAPPTTSSTPPPADPTVPTVVPVGPDIMTGIAPDQLAVATPGAVEQIVPLPPLPTTVPWRAGEVITRIPTARKIVVFTFDDGPDTIHERRIHQILSDRGYAGKAAFCFVGVNVQNHPDVCHEMFDHGYEICNHSMTHSTYAVGGEVREISQAQEAIHSVTGVYPTFYRAAGGTMDGSINNECARCGLTYIWTDNDEFDYRDPRIPPEAINHYLARNLEPGYISLRHSGGTHNNTVAAMHQAIDIVEQAGYEIMSLRDALTCREDGVNSPIRTDRPQSAGGGSRSSGDATSSVAVGADGPAEFDVLADIRAADLSGDANAGG